MHVLKCISELMGADQRSDRGDCSSCDLLRLLLYFASGSRMGLLQLFAQLPDLLMAIFKLVFLRGAKHLDLG